MKPEYKREAHRMQAGVAMEMQNPDNNETTPKQLRVGVNSAMVDTSAMTTLLIKKGLITQTEYLEQLAVSMQEEADRYEKKVQERLGPNVKLGSLY